MAAPPTAHLAAERLAALADEPPTPAEAAHLAACGACREEQAAYVALVDLARGEGAAAYAPYAAPPHDVTDVTDARAEAAWTAIAATLRAEGLAGDGAVRRAARIGPAERAARLARRTRARAWEVAGRGPVRAWGRMAAGLLLTAAAAGVGRLSAARGPWAVDPAAASPAAAVAAAGVAAAPNSAEAARAMLTRARQQYVLAASVLAAAEPAGDPAVNDTADDRALVRPDASESPASPDASPDATLLQARVAALDALLPPVRDAARAAPQDPAVNHVYLTAYDAREAALRQLGRSLPNGVQLTSY